MVTISIETIGEERFIRGFNRIEADMADMRPIFQDISLDFYRREKQIFARQGDPVGFKALSPAYKKWKSLHFPGRKIMQLTRRLMISLTDPDRAKAGDVVKKIGRKAAEFGSIVPYVHRHQMGTRGMPKRMIVQLTEKDKIRWGRMIHEWAKDLIREHLN